MFQSMVFVFCLQAVTAFYLNSGLNQLFSKIEFEVTRIQASVELAGEELLTLAAQIDEGTESVDDIKKAIRISLQRVMFNDDQTLDSSEVSQRAANLAFEELAEVVEKE